MTAEASRSALYIQLQTTVELFNRLSRAPGLVLSPANGQRTIMQCPQLDDARGRVKCKGRPNVAESARAHLGGAPTAQERGL